MADQDRTILKSHQSPVADYPEQKICFVGRLTAVEAEIYADEEPICDNCDLPASFGPLCAEHYLAERMAYFSRMYSVSESGCWLWNGSKNGGGYGLIRFGEASILAHRFSWATANNRPLADGMHCCHSCDTPACVNPAHLWEGTAKQNAVDSMAKGRRARALTPELIRRIYTLKQAGVWLDKDIARIVGVSPSTVGGVLAGKRWDLGVGKYTEKNISL